MLNAPPTAGRTTRRVIRPAALCLVSVGLASRPAAAVPPATTMPAATPPDAAWPNPFLSAAPEPHQDAEYQAALGDVEASLARCPPTLDPSPERRDALTMLDLMFHDPFARDRGPVRAFHARRAERTADALAHDAPPTDGATIYMFYNMGFVVRTRGVTLGFDLIRAKHLGPFAVADDVMKRIVDQCDVLFISHVHLDHADPWVAQTFIDQGKPVVAPPDLWTADPIHARLTRLKRAATLRQAVPVRGGHASIDVVVDPGFQAIKTGDGVTCNVYVVRTPEGLLVAHTGDNNTYRPTGSNWADPRAGPQRIDVLLLNDWTMIQSPKALRGYDPRLVIAGHYDELGHDNVNARAPYWRGLIHARKSVYPWLVMTWGESFEYRRQAMPASPFPVGAAR